MSLSIPILSSRHLIAFTRYLVEHSAQLAGVENEDAMEQDFQQVTATTPAPAAPAKNSIAAETQEQ